jgi:2-polyprenyl-3-methyl-5-hydroxy-6-metoxy-1,4-benzoquinol methylase
MSEAAAPHPCPSCGSSAARKLGIAGVCHLWRCGKCRLVFVDRSLWRDPYAQADYYAPQFQPEILYPLKPRATDRDRINSVLKHCSSGRFLDYGGGIGRTALAGHDAGFEVTVLDDSAKAITDGETHHPEIRWIRGNRIPDEMPDASQDVVTLFHVLEHLPEPRLTLQSIQRVLRPGGLLIVEVPNWGSHLRRLQGLRWTYVIDHHLNHFDAHSLSQMAVAAGFVKGTLEYRRTFDINERQHWKEPIKALLSHLGFANIMRYSFIKQ